MWQCYLCWLIDSGQVDIRVAPGSHATEAAGKTFLLFSFSLWIRLCYAPILSAWTVYWSIQYRSTSYYLDDCPFHFLLGVMNDRPVTTLFLDLNLFGSKMRCCVVEFYLMIICFTQTTILLPASLFQGQFAESIICWNFLWHFYNSLYKSLIMTRHKYHCN